MKISYEAQDDILHIEFSSHKIVKDVSHGWNVNIGYDEHNGIVELTILDAKKSGYWPPENRAELLRMAA